LLARVRSKITYANIVASLALFVALGGVSYAAITIPKNSVGSTQLKANAVTSVKVKDGTLEQADFAPGALPASGANGANGANGEQGESGERGETGDEGERGEQGETGATGQRGEQGEQGDDGEDAALLDPANYLPPGVFARIFINEFSVATFQAYRIDCVIDGCRLSIGLSMTQNTELDAWFEAAMQGDPSATRDFTIVEFAPGGGAERRRYLITNGRPISRRTLNERLEMTFDVELIQRIEI
jgi:hypothetical protein